MKYLAQVHVADMNSYQIFHNINWRSGVRSVMRAASQLPGRGPTVVDMAPIPAC